MKRVSIKLTSITDKLVWIGIGLGVLSWIVEASIHVLVSPQDKFAEQLLTPPLHDICLRSVIAGLLIIFSVYAQFIINKRKRAEEALQEAHDELEQRVEERTAELARTGEQLRLELTERKRAEEELRKYRDHLEDMVRERTMELEAAQKELLEKERLAVLGQLTAMVSHELRNPLGVIGSSAYYLQRKLGRAEEKIAKHVGRIEEQVELCDSIVGELLEYTRGQRPELVQGEINHAMKTARICR
jgi:C4-dicarboxylate-specific signal transduction histidine kinase